MNQIFLLQDNIVRRLIILKQQGFLGDKTIGGFDFNMVLSLTSMFSIDKTPVIDSYAFELSLDDIVDEMNKYFEFLANKEINLKKLKEIISKHKTTIETKIEQITKQLESLEIYFEKIRSYSKTKRKNEKGDNISEQIKVKQFDILHYFIDIILYDLNTFSAFKIYAKSFSDTFICFLRDRMCDTILACPDNFSDCCAGINRGIQIKKIIALNGKVDEALKIKSSKPKDSNSKTSAKDESYIYYGGLLENIFGNEINDKIYELDKMFKTQKEKLLYIEKLILKWYSKVLGGTESERIRLFNPFIKDYIKRQKIITEKYVEFFKLDKYKYIMEKEDLTPSEYLGFEVNDFFIDNQLTID